jgi:hypothetical protein
MASKTVVELIDDITGEVADESVRFGLDGIEYTIDLTEANAAELRGRLEAFVESAQRVKATKGSTAPRPARTGEKRATSATNLGREQNQAIREWARAQGEKVSERGRIPAELVTRFQEAHASAPEPELELIDA